MKSRVDLIEKNFREGCNCCQSVLLAYADVCHISREQALKLASPFGAGYGKLREICGAVSGMTMVAGLVKGYSDLSDRDAKIACYALEQKMVGEYTEAKGTIICRKHLNLQPGEDLPEPAIRTEEYYQSRPCISLVRLAGEILEKNVFAGEIDETE